MFTSLLRFIPADEQEEDFPGRVGSFFFLSSRLVGGFITPSVLFPLY